jgi:hypothetical protein
MALLLTGCAVGQEERVWLQSQGWSRAQVVGETRLSAPSYMAIDSAGQAAMLLFTGDDPARLRLVILNPQGQPMMDRILADVRVGLPRLGRVAWASDRLHLLWIDGRDLFYLAVDHDGLPRHTPRRLSAGHQATWFDLTEDPAYPLQVWFSGDRRTPGLYRLSSVENQAPPTLVDADGIHPDLVSDQEGRLHAVWARQSPDLADNTFLYAVQADRETEGLTFHQVYQPVFGSTDEVEGPWLGLDGSHVYIFWRVSIRTGLRAGAIEARWLSFPIGRPGPVDRDQVIFLPSEHALESSNMASTGLASGPRADPAASAAPTSNIMELSPNRRQEAEMSLALRVRVAYKLRSDQAQIGIAYFRDGELTGYQLLSFTPGSSAEPALLSDQRRNLFVSWQEKGDQGGFKVFYAGTSTEIREAMTPLTRGDWLSLASETVFGMLSGIVLIPLALIWIVPCLIVLGLTTWLRRGEPGILHPGVMLTLALSLAAYWTTKLMVLPDIRTYVPFSAWIPIIPPALGSVLRLTVPLAVAGLGLLAGWRMSYGRGGTSPTLFVLMYALVDGVFTLAIYGVLMLST